MSIRTLNTTTPLLAVGFTSARIRVEQQCYLSWLASETQYILPYCSAQRVNEQLQTGLCWRKGRNMAAQTRNCISRTNNKCPIFPSVCWLWLKTKIAAKHPPRPPRVEEYSKRDTENVRRGSSRCAEVRSIKAGRLGDFNSRIGKSCNPNENIRQYGESATIRTGQRCWSPLRTILWRRWTERVKKQRQNGLSNAYTRENVSFLTIAVENGSKQQRDSSTCMRSARTNHGSLRNVDRHPTDDSNRKQAR